MTPIRLSLARPCDAMSAARVYANGTRLPNLASLNARSVLTWRTLEPMPVAH